MVKFNLRAVLPVAQYSNIQPEWEVEADTYEEAMAIAEGHLVPFWNKYVEGGKELKTSKGEFIDGIGGSIYYDPVAHVYTNEEGVVYESSSQYASKFAKPFDKQAISKKMSERDGVSQEDLLEQWELKSKISRDLGTALHEAIELKRRFGVLHTSPMLSNAVTELEKLLPVGDEKLEAVVVDHEAKRVGRVDLIQITAPQECNVVDFKTGEMKDHYWKQTEFTAGILVVAGYKVNKMRIFHYSGKWEVHEKEYKNAGNNI